MFFDHFKKKINIYNKNFIIKIIIQLIRKIPKLIKFLLNFLFIHF